MNVRIIIATVILIITSVFIVPAHSSAIESDSEYKTNLKDKQADDLFDLSIGDITDPLEWLKSRNTYSLLETTPSGQQIYWFNVPNLQTVIYNQATQVIPTGYMGSGSIPRDRNDTALIKLPKAKNAHTAMQRYGFRIPSPAYIGETPKITLSVMGVLIEDNPITFAVNKVKGLFGGSIISAPDKKDYQTLKYISPSDYSPTENTFEKWAGLYWNDVMKEMEAGQVLISGADKEGKKDGVQFVKQTVITDNGLDRIDDPKKLDDELKKILGPDYQDVVSNIVAFGVDSESAKSFDQSPERIMPYDVTTLTDTDAKNLVSDPRVEKQTPVSVFGLEINVGLDNMALNQVAKLFISIAGGVSELTVFLNSVTTFSTIEAVGIDVTELWSSPIMTVLSVVVMVGLLVVLLGHITKIARGGGSVGKALTHALVSFVVLGVIFCMSTNTDKTYRTIKSATSVFLNVGSSITEMTGTGKELMGDGSKEEKVQTNYWIPYFSLWSEYNTSKNLNDKSLVINKSAAKNEPEQNDMTMPKLGDHEIPLWNANLAEAFTSGPMIDKDAYRTVDHLMAPRLKVGDAPKIFETSRNENYSKPVQSSFDIGLFLLVIVLFVGVVIKVVLFLEFVYYLVMAPVNLALSTYAKGRVQRMGKEFAASFVRVGLWDIVISMVVYISMITSGVMSLLFSVLLVIGFVKGLQALSYSNSVFVPNTLRIARKYF